MLDKVVEKLAEKVVRIEDRVREELSRKENEKIGEYLRKEKLIITFSPEKKIPASTLYWTLTAFKMHQYPPILAPYSSFITHIAPYHEQYSVIALVDNINILKPMFDFRRLLKIDTFILSENLPKQMKLLDTMEIRFEGGFFEKNISVKERGLIKLCLYVEGAEYLGGSYLITQAFLEKKKSSITLEYPSEIYAGDEVTITGRLNPPLAKQVILVTVEGPQATTLNYQVVTGPDGVFVFKTKLPYAGKWIFKFTWRGNEYYSSAVSSMSINVKEFYWKYLNEKTAIAVSYTHLTLPTTERV